MMYGPRALSDLRTALGGMLEDPDVTEDLLLVGVALAHHIYTASPPWRLEDAVVGAFHGGRARAVDLARVTLGMDVPRYDHGGRPAGGVLARHLPLIDWPRAWDELGGPKRPVDAKPGMRLIIDPHAGDEQPQQPQLRLVRH